MKTLILSLLFLALSTALPMVQKRKLNHNKLSTKQLAASKFELGLSALKRLVKAEARARGDARLADCSPTDGSRTVTEQCSCGNTSCTAGQFCFGNSSSCHNNQQAGEIVDLQTRMSSLEATVSGLTASCDGVDCGAHGTCNAGTCVCTGGYSGTLCNHANAVVKDDPHIAGFDGSSFDFRGIPNYVFNLISDKNFQMNSLFVESPVDTKTYMGEIAIRLPSNQLHFECHSIKLNGEKVEMKDSTVSLKGIAGKEEASLVIRQDDSYTVTTPAWTIRVMLVKWIHHRLPMMHLNFEASVHPQHLYNPHGILGQTAQYLVKGESPSPKHASSQNPNGMGIIEGDPEDYLVADGLWGTRFKFNRFGVEAEQPEYVSDTGPVGGGAFYLPPAKVE